MITSSFSGKDGNDTEVLEPEAIAVPLRENLIGIESDVVQGLAELAELAVDNQEELMQRERVDQSMTGDVRGCSSLGLIGLVPGRMYRNDRRGYNALVQHVSAVFL